MSNYFVTAKNHIELNSLTEQFQANIKNEKTLRLHIKILGDSITSYWVKSKPDNQPKYATINNRECILTTTHKTSVSTYTLITPLWKNDQIPRQQLLEIDFQKEIEANTLSIVASNRPSFWHILQLIRKDLPNHSIYELTKWIICGGIHDLNIITEEVSVISALNKRIKGTLFRIFHACIWNTRPDLEASFYFINSPSFLPWLQEHGAKEYGLKTLDKNHQLNLEYSPSKKFSERHFGVNLFGYASEMLGIGEDVRTTQAALEQQGIPTTVIDIPTKHTSEALRKRSKNESESVAPYAFNIFCLTAEEHARIVMELGHNILNERFNIGYWPWELSEWPEPWKPLLCMVDEIWASSTHIENILDKIIDSDVHPSLAKCPLGIEDLNPLSEDSRNETRHNYNLPTDQAVVICSFDGRSSFQRKNPWASIEAFQKAFGNHDTSDQAPHLIIKTMHASIDTREWEKLQKVEAESSNIHLVDDKLSRTELIKLYGSCDVLLSLHRAEGYGRIMAECLLLGLEVVATNYSGNTDFCEGPLFHPVKYQLTFVPENTYTQSKEQEWAEPDINHASMQLQKSVKCLDKSEEEIKKNHSIYYNKLSLKSVGEKYKQRLSEIWRTNNLTGEQLSWNNSSSVYSLGKNPPF